MRSVAWKRAEEHRGALASMLLLTLVLCGLVSFTLGYQQASAVDGTRAILAARDAAPVSAYLETTLDSTDPRPQAAAARNLFQRVFTGTPTVIDRTLRTVPQAAGPSGASAPTDPAELVFADVDSLRARATIVTGSWPSQSTPDPDQPLQAVLQADSAARLDVQVGDQLVIGNDEPRTTVIIAGTWQPTDRTDPFWVGDPTIMGGLGADADGLVLISASAFSDLTTSPLVRWVIRPDAEQIRPDQVPTMARALDRLADSARQDEDVVIDGVRLEPGGLGPSLERIDRSVIAGQGVTPLPIIMIATIGLLTLALVARLLAGGQSAETSLLKARGASPGQLFRMSLLESTVVGILGAAGGLAVAAVGLLIAGAVPDVAFAGWLVAPMTASATCLLMVGTQWVDVRPSVVGSPARQSGRGTRAASAGVVVLALGAAGVSLFQFRLYGSPLVTDAAGRLRVDPLAVLAPVLCLLALCLVLLLALAASLAVGQPAATRLRSLGPAFTIRQLSRRVTAVSVPFLAVAASIALTTVTASYGATWDRLTTTSAQLSNAADVRVTVPTTTTAPTLRTAAFARLPGVQKAAPVLTTPVEIGSEPLTLTAVAATDVRAVVTSAGGAIDQSAVGTAMAARRAGPLLPVGTVAVDLTIDYTVDGAAPDPAQRPEVTVWLADEDGLLTSIPLAAAPGASTYVLSGPVPVASEPWRVVAVDVSIDGIGSSSAYGFEVTSVGARTAQGGAANVGLGDGWTAETRPFGGSETALNRDDAVGFDLTLIEPARPQVVRLLPPAADVLPLVIDRVTAARLGLGVGDKTQVTFAGSGLVLTGRVTLVAAVLPGGAPVARVLVDLPALLDAVLREAPTVPAVNEMWIAAATAGAVATVRTAAGPGATVTTPGDGSGGPILSGTSRSMWTGAIGVTVLAVLAVGVTSAMAIRARRSEVIVLRAAGVAPWQQGRGRARELLAVVVAALLAGLGVGVAVSVLTVAPLAHSAVIDVPSDLPVPLEWAVGTGSLLVGGFVLAALLVVARSSALVQAQARHTEWREDVR